MKAKKALSKVLALTLAFVLLVPLMCGALTTDASADSNALGKYPTVLIHGFLGWGPEDKIDGLVPYWGMLVGSMEDYFNGLGGDTYTATVGPLSSCWDRCCELFAQLTGTKTDYGQAHCNRVLAEFEDVGCTCGHERYGRDYTGSPLFEGWGPIYKNGKVTGWYDNKLNLVGHSFGGPTSAYFTYLLAEGDAAERDWAKQQAKANGGDWHDYCSPLFWGDYNGEQYVNSVVSLAGVLNGTTFINCEPDFSIIVTTMMDLMANTIGNTPINSVYDFQMEQFGITKSTNPDYHYTLDLIRAKGFLDGYDNALYDLSITGCNKLKLGWECYDNVYYFAYAGRTTHADPHTGYEVPNKETMIVFFPFATAIGKYTNPNEVVTDIYGKKFCTIDEKWFPNDGMVNTITASYVFGCPHKDYDGNNVPGMWITMPDWGYDHGDFVGGMPDAMRTISDARAFFRDIANNIASTCKGGGFTDVAQGSYCYDAVNWAADKGITKGVDSTHFAPNNDCTRGQVVTFLWRAAGCPEPTAKCAFKDVDSSAYYAKAVAWAAEKGITKGIDKTHFAPNTTVSRAEFVTFLWRYEGMTKASGKCAFTDVEKGAFYYDAVVWAAKNGITTGIDKTHFAPASSCTRGQVVTFMYRNMK